VNVTAVTSRTLPILTCPSDPNAGKYTAQNFGVSSHNYAVNWGNTVRRQYTYGGVDFLGAPFAYGGKQFRIADITDGTSGTLLAAEVLQGISENGKTDLRGFTWWGPAAGFMGYVPPNSSLPDIMQAASYCNNRPDQGLPCTQSSTGENMYGARSRHTGGVNAALCDASVRFFSNTIPAPTWAALSTSQGSEVIDATAN
jgi:prepilin-type processing-associated H-X9-DG protein